MQLFACGGEEVFFAAEQRRIRLGPIEGLLPRFQWPMSAVCTAICLPSGVVSTILPIRFEHLDQRSIRPTYVDREPKHPNQDWDGRLGTRRHLQRFTSALQLDNLAKAPDRVDPLSKTLLGAGSVS